MERNSLVPATCTAAGAHWFDPSDAAHAWGHRGYTPLRSGGRRLPCPPIQWRHSDATTDHFGTIIDAAVTKGINFTSWSGTLWSTTKVPSIVRSSRGDGELETWKTDKQKEDFNQWLISETKSNETLADLFPSLSGEGTWSMLSGPRATQGSHFMGGYFWRYRAEMTFFTSGHRWSPTCRGHQKEEENILNLLWAEEGTDTAKCGASAMEGPKTTPLQFYCNTHLHPPLAVFSPSPHPPSPFIAPRSDRPNMKRSM